MHAVRPGVQTNVTASAQDIVTAADTLRERGHRRISPHFIPRMLVNMAGDRLHSNGRYRVDGESAALTVAPRRAQPGRSASVPGPKGPRRRRPRRARPVRMRSLTRLGCLPQARVVGWRVLVLPSNGHAGSYRLRLCQGLGCMHDYD